MTERAISDCIENLVEIHGLSRAFEGSERVANVLDGIDFLIPYNSFTVIRGPSGAGKSTLLRILGLLDAGFTGSMRLAGKDVAMLTASECDAMRTAVIGLVFQEGRLLPHLSLAENIALPLQFAGLSHQEVATQAEQAETFAFRAEERAAGVTRLRPSVASGGQRQRAALARAMVRSPALILADEPTSNLDQVSKAQVVERLTAMCAAGATVLIVSHDEALFGLGRQFSLENGQLLELPRTGGLQGVHTPRGPFEIPSAPLSGWWPSLPLWRLIRNATRDLLRRPLFTLLLLIAVIAGTAQSAVFASLIGGLDHFVEQTVADGTRLTRVTLKPRKADLANSDARFPEQAAMLADPDVTAAVARRATTVSIVVSDASNRPYPSLGLYPDDPELSMFHFVAGTGFGAKSGQFQMIATTDFLLEIFGTAAVNSDKDWASFIGRQVKASIPRFGTAGKQIGTEPLTLTITGVILKGEADRQFYLPNELIIAIDAIKRDRTGKLQFPTNADQSAWRADADITSLIDWPWQDMVHLYLKNIDDVIPKVSILSARGYHPEAEIWKYSWILNLKSAAYGIIAPLLGLLTGVVGLVLFGNIVISTRLREAELAVLKVLGMRRGDILATEVIGTLITATFGLAVGLIFADRLTIALSFQLQESARIAAQMSGNLGSVGIAFVFQPVWSAAPIISAGTIGLVIVSVLWPTVRAACADPAAVFSRS